MHVLFQMAKKSPLMQERDSQALVWEFVAKREGMPFVLGSFSHFFPFWFCGQFFISEYYPKVFFLPKKNIGIRHTVLLTTRIITTKVININSQGQKIGNS